MKADYNTKKVVSWAVYDWANSAFATTVMAGFFPIFFKQYWSVGADVTTSTFKLGLANSLASIIVALLSPLLGAIADKGSAKKRFLLFFATMGIVMTGSLHFVVRGDWEIAAACYILANVGFASGNIFYDSLILSVTGEKKVDFVSALGFSLGYLGGGLLFALNVAMTLSPETFGLADANTAVRISFLTVAIWWALFSIPIFFFVDEPKAEDRFTGWKAAKAGFQQLKATFHEVRKLRVVFLFLISYWLYIDGVHTIIRMSVDYGISLGFDSKSLIVALLITQFVGFPAAIIFGKIGEKIGAKTGISIGIGVYVAVTIWGFYMQKEWEFFALAITIGLVQGGVQSLSRSFYIRLIPENKAAEFFGFYNMLGKFAAVIGPVLMGWVSVTTGNPRYSILSIIPLFISGVIILSFVDKEKGHQMAEELKKF
ncbi:MAG: MFS transporter [Thermodesulfobacteriota bacterium]